jgi:RNA recognition motif-containing protein
VELFLAVRQDCQSPGDPEQRYKKSDVYGFVTFFNAKESELAMLYMDGRDLQGSTITVVRAEGARFQKYSRTKRLQRWARRR